MPQQSLLLRIELVAARAAGRVGGGRRAACSTSRHTTANSERQHRLCARRCSKGCPPSYSGRAKEGCARDAGCRARGAGPLGARAPGSFPAPGPQAVDCPPLNPRDRKVLPPHLVPGKTKMQRREEEDAGQPLKSSGKGTSGASSRPAWRAQHADRADRHALAGMR